MQLCDNMHNRGVTCNIYSVMIIKICSDEQYNMLNDRALSNIAQNDSTVW